MAAVDTNIVVRLLTADHPAQFKTSQKVFATGPVYIADTVILETEWVLRAAYDLAPMNVCEAFRYLFGLPNVALANPQAIAQALAWHEGGLDFADALHLSLSQGQEKLLTFDADFVKRAKALSECKVESP